MAETVLAGHLADERSTAARILLGQPVLDADSSPDDFRLVARHAGWLAEYFEKACGWVLTVDIGAGFARLAKRAPADGTGAGAGYAFKRSRGAGAAFDRRRYQLLCLVCAELVRLPVTTVGLLAAGIRSEAGFDSSKLRERAAFVDALRALMAWGALRATAGDVDAFVQSDRGNAILTADTARLHRLIVSAVPPSTLPAGLDTDAAADRLRAEPRYGEAPEHPGEVGDESRNRWARHQLARRLLDGPVMHVEDLSPVEADYLASSSGRRWLRERAAEAGFELEERAEGLLAVDPDAIATDATFPAPAGHAHQLALLLADRLVTTDATGRRALGRLSPTALQDEIDAVFARYPAWARGQREEGSPERLGREAVELLASFGLVRAEPDGGVVARPALARYRVGTPILTASAPSLFDGDQ